MRKLLLPGTTRKQNITKQKQKQTIKKQNKTKQEQNKTKNQKNKQTKEQTNKQTVTQSAYDHITKLEGEIWNLWVNLSCLWKILIKGVLHPEPKISMFCALSQNCQRLYEK